MPASALHASLLEYLASLTHLIPKPREVPLSLQLLEINLKLALYGQHSIAFLVLTQPHYHSYLVAQHLVHLYERKLLPLGYGLAAHIYNCLLLSADTDTVQRRALQGLCDLLLASGQVLKALKWALIVEGGVEMVGRDKFMLAAA